MPFESCFGRAFTAVTIEREAPAASGVYGVSNSQHWIYISESEDIRASLMGYLAECGPLSQDSPTGFSFELSPAYSRIARRDRLIAELSPVQPSPVQNPPVQNHGATALSRRRERS